ncbi:hypothetical protein L596_015198 [Steinernema carpocapsae]|uniref:Uncharacterized protein n=1 Tax=Steinernema carpocapsae TaxID=34508 RepID=A0A4U5NEH2_STECR|nr:hypothetical protein L596_015198 [Steinernema carpocapsae]
MHYTGILQIINDSKSSFLCRFPSSTRMSYDVCLRNTMDRPRSRRYVANNCLKRRSNDVRFQADKNAETGQHASHCYAELVRLKFLF